MFWTGDTSTFQCCIKHRLRCWCTDIPACVLRLQRLPISLPELVESAPSLTADGSIILGRRDSKVFLVDKRTGRGVHTLSNAAEALEDHSSSLGEWRQQLRAGSSITAGGRFCLKTSNRYSNVWVRLGSTSRVGFVWQITSSSLLPTLHG